MSWTNNPLFDPMVYSELIKRKLQENAMQNMELGQGSQAPLPLPAASQTNIPQLSPGAMTAQPPAMPQQQQGQPWMEAIQGIAPLIAGIIGGPRVGSGMVQGMQHQQELKLRQDMLRQQQAMEQQRIAQEQQRLEFERQNMQRLEGEAARRMKALSNETNSKLVEDSIKFNIPMEELAPVYGVDAATLQTLKPVQESMRNMIQSRTVYVDIGTSKISTTPDPNNPNQTPVDRKELPAFLKSLRDNEFMYVTPGGIYPESQLPEALKKDPRVRGPMNPEMAKSQLGYQQALAAIQNKTPNEVELSIRASQGDKDAQAGLQFLREHKAAIANAEAQARQKAEAGIGMGGAVIPQPGTILQATPLGETNESVLNGVDEGTKAIVKKIAAYEVPLPSGFALRSPQWMRILNLVSQYKPAFDATQYQIRLATRRSFTSGKDAQTITSINTLVGHLGSLDKAAKALGNVDFTPYNTLANFMIQKFGDPRVKRFEIDATAVENELAAIFKRTGATDQEIKAWRNHINSSDSPGMLRTAVTEAIDLMASRLSAIDSLYEKAMGEPRDFKILDDKSRSILKSLGSNPELIDSVGGSSKASSVATQPQQVEEERVAMPDGTVHIYDKKTRKYLRTENK